MRVLVVTGQLAKDIVREVLEGTSLEYEVCDLPVQVASLMSPTYIAWKLQGRSLSKVDCILIPGLVKGDASKVTEKTGLRCWKGPKNAADLPQTINMIGKIRLSTIRPADEILRKVTRREVEATLIRIEMEAEMNACEESTLTIGVGERSVKVGPGLPMRVLAEIVDAPTYPPEEVVEIAKRFEDSGADIIDVGMVAGGGHEGEAARIVKVLRGSISKPVSIDTADPSEIEAAVEAGADLILSVNAENMCELSEHVKETPVVVTSSGRGGILSHDPFARVEQLVENMNMARSLGFKKLIADPILDPPLTMGTAKSLSAYLKYRELDPRTPMLFGSGNVTELLDGDSYGVNLLLACLASEVGANIILTTEASIKTRGSVKEAVTAARMVEIARYRKTPPKDLGLNLLRMKEKTWREEPHRAPGEMKQIKVESRRRKKIGDPGGSFKISLDRERGQIVMRHYPYGAVEPDLYIEGSDPEGLIDTLIDSRLVTRLEHAFYLGKELEKAKIALETGKCYIQDFKLDFGEYIDRI
ncbi:dihydropteroate synthase-like protein [Candidatus Bathyarchaeota archaeon]|nr:dihydropteroate synthase-like protein [Candidatus Bathyarchaeota archaeon]MBS7628479.1 dihydropteroate synthase-like protein [Candidatus Bathyarchaeota archaeon]